MPRSSQGHVVPTKSRSVKKENKESRKIGIELDEEKDQKEHEMGIHKKKEMPVAMRIELMPGSGFQQNVTQCT